MPDRAPQVKMPRSSWLGRQHWFQGFFERLAQERSQRRARRWEFRTMSFDVMKARGISDVQAHRIVENLTPMRPWLKERYDHLKWTFSENGRFLKEIQRMARDEQITAIRQIRHDRRVRSEHEQAQHIARWWQEEHDIADDDLFMGLRPLHPTMTDDQLHDLIDQWSLRSRLKAHYRIRSEIRTQIEHARAEAERHGKGRVSRPGMTPGERDPASPAGRS